MFFIQYNKQQNGEDNLSTKGREELKISGTIKHIKMSKQKSMPCIY